MSQTTNLTANTKIWVPRCPRCGYTHMVLAPIKRGIPLPVEEFPVYCFDCTWVGTMKEVRYVRL